MSLRPDEGRLPAITEQDEAGADDRHGDVREGVRVEFVGDVELNPAAAKVLLRILRKHAERQAGDVSSRPVSASTEGAGGTEDDGSVSPPDGDDEVGPLRLGTASRPHPSPAEGANTVPSLPTDGEGVA